MSSSAGLAVVAFGGGHGLAATLRALRSLELTPTAIVGVADDGGSSGRIRAEFDCLPPGDLRMALAALCPDPQWARLLQHRFPGDGGLAGHSLGNLLISAAWQQSGDPVVGLAEVAELIGVRGSVLPASTQPMTIHAQTLLPDGRTAEVIGQGQVAITPGRVQRVWVTPAEPVARLEAVQAVQDADVVIVGPGSWYTSVVPHLLIPELRGALEGTVARRILVVNVRPRNDEETRGLAVHDHIRILLDYAPDIRFDVIIADPAHVESTEALDRAAETVGARVEYAALESPTQPGTHDPTRLGAVLRHALPET